MVPIADDGTVLNPGIILYTLDLRVNGTSAVVGLGIGGGQAPALSLAPTGTLTIGPNVAQLRALGKCRLRVENVTAHNYATSAVVNFYLRARMQ
jgi:hypothetical protein